ncbi:MAG: hypothetical protein VYD62_01860, partial [Candidatus Thermoplasmatota archaeon]|nr:hypothetical protein [Candidatus Thermoplasmatota archaeon]
MRLTLSELKKKISKMIPDDVDYEVDLEAGSIAIITKQPEAFGGAGDNLTVRIAKTIKRRIVIRPHRDILADEKTVHDAVTQIIPPDAEVRKVWLDPALSQVILECDDPSTAVGRKGSNIRALRDE